MSQAVTSVTDSFASSTLMFHCVSRIPTHRFLQGFGRGELHLSVLIENMRREGYEFAVSKAEVLYKYDENGKKLEPMELAYIDVPDEFTGAVISKLQQRKGELRNMGSIAGGYTRLEFNIPARGLIGYRGEFMTDTKGNGILNTMFDGYEPYKGEIAYRATGSLIAFES